MYRAVVITLSDRGARGERQDKSGPKLKERLLEAGYDVSKTYMIPDDQEKLMSLLIEIADKGAADFIITTGGTGLSPRDNTPEATLAVIDKEVPGIMEWIRMKSMEITPRAMLSRGVCGVRCSTLILNVPGSPKGACECLDFVIDQLPHALDILTRQDTDCGRR